MDIVLRNLNRKINEANRNLTLTATYGTYTPTLTNTLNLDGSTANQCFYLRIGTVVHVAGTLSANPTAAGDTQLGISIPVASAFTDALQLGGTAVSSAVAGLCAAIMSDATNDRALMRWVAVDTSDRAFNFTFSYSVV